MHGTQGISAAQLDSVQLSARCLQAQHWLMTAAAFPMSTSCSLFWAQRT